MIEVRIGIAAAVLAGALVFPRFASAFRCTRVAGNVGPSLVWPSRSVPWWLDAEVAHLADGAGKEAAEAAIAGWSAPPCTDLELWLAGVGDDLVAGFVPGGDNENAVVFAEPGRLDFTTIALTVAAFDPRTGEILDVDIELNRERFRFDVLPPAGCRDGEISMDLGNTLAHEAGHLIGLDHPPSLERYRQSTMFASAAPCETSKRDLAALDIEAVCSIYPAGEPTNPCYPPDNRGLRVVDRDRGHGCASSSAAHASLALLVLSLRRRR